ncbi:MAG: Ig-like domain-containing protein, partial [Burkholderiales bacterium]
MPSAGDTTVELTAVVLNANGRALTEKAVTLAVVDSATSGKAFLTNVADETDTNGLLLAKLNLGTNKSNRTITIRATADSATATNTVDVVGTTITISGATSLVSNATTPITVSLKDSGGNSLQGETISLSSSQGNTFSSAAPVTNRSGQVVVDVTGTTAGTDTITATALGASNTMSIVVSGSDFSFIAPSPASNTDVVVNTAHQIKIRWREGNVPQNGLAVTLSATRGTVSPSSGLTDASGEFTATITSAFAGPTTVQASATGGSPSTTLNFVFVTSSATAVNVQADPTTIPINANGSDANRATITAIVRDGASNLVKNARVQFQIVTDTTGGRLSGTEDITDV